MRHQLDSCAERRLEHTGVRRTDRAPLECVQIGSEARGRIEPLDRTESLGFGCDHACAQVLFECLLERPR
jgi:hypothetical protein